MATLPFVRGPAVAAGPEQSRSGFDAIPKALWVWRVSETGLPDLLSYAKSNAVDTILLSLFGSLMAKIEEGDRSTLDRLNAFRMEGLSLFGLIGDPGWIRTPGRMPDFAGRTVELMLRHRGLFDGLSLDVEPNALKEWHSPDLRSQLMSETVGLFRTMRAKAGGIHIDAAFNPVFAKLDLPDGKSFLHQLAEQVDSVGLMAYRRGASRAVAWADAAIDTLDPLVPWRMGVLVDTDAESGTSYSGESRSAFAEQMILLDNLLRSRKPRNYRGLIFEDYRSLRKLL